MKLAFRIGLNPTGHERIRKGGVASRSGHGPAGLLYIYIKKGGFSVAVNNEPMSAQQVVEPPLTTQEKHDLAIYPLSDLGGGIYKAYFTTYISLLMTSVYVFPVILAGILETIQAATNWVGAPLFGTIYDRFSFKKAKYWPWWFILGFGVSITYALVFSLPLFSAHPEKLAVPAAILIAVAAIMSAGNGVLGASAVHVCGIL